MKLVICAGPATTGKTAVLRHLTRKLLGIGQKVAFLKLDVQFAEEDEELRRELGIPTRKVYSGELCPDHCSVMVLGDALRWAASRVFSAPLHLRRAYPGKRFSLSSWVREDSNLERIR